MHNQTDKVKGKYNSAIGKVKETAGVAVNDKDLESRGLKQMDQGQNQQDRAAIKGKIEKGSRDVGNAIKKAGDKVAHLAD